ncbi:hypothetical protein ACFO1B_49675 [Dactylosporangium siamense]|nr:hypothetical protein [Dactylosporangium siamense]
MRRGPVRWAMPGVLLSVLLALGILSGSDPAPQAAEPMPPTPAVLMPAVLPASVNAVRPDVQLAADRLTGDGAAVWLFVAAMCALLARPARPTARTGGGAAGPAGSSLVVLGALRGRAPPHVVR